MHCFGIVPKLIKTPVDLLKVLLSLHSRRVRLPDDPQRLPDREPDEETRRSRSWPLAEILPDREAFLRFLQAEWAASSHRAGRPGEECRVPFSHEDVRAYIDTLFLDGLLTPVEREDAVGLPSWALDRGASRHRRATPCGDSGGCSDRFEAELPTGGASHRDWQQAAQRWAELVVLRWEWDAALDEGDRDGWDTLQGKLEDRFGAWMMRAVRLASQPAVPPAARDGPPHPPLPGRRAEPQEARQDRPARAGRAGVDQWLLLRRHLEATDPSWRFQESTAFAWVPTVTSVTRQSIFAGEAPFFFPDSFETTAKERGPLAAVLGGSGSASRAPSNW